MISENSTSGIFWGVVEDRDSDPMKSGRCKVRVVGVHTEDKVELPTDDLPWAYPLQDIRSAAMSGIGESPLGPVEGSWVAVTFRDVYQQHPVIMGVVGGIPGQTEAIDVEARTTTVQGGLVDSQGNPVNDSSGNQVRTNSTPPAKVEQQAIRKPGALTVTPEGTAWMQDNEALASMSATKRVIGNRSVLGTTKIYAYRDSGDVWTIGWGNTFYADGRRVGEGDSITKAEADALFDVKKKEFVDGINRSLKVPVTQSMFESLVDMSYNMGHGGLTRSAFWSTLNTGDYQAAAAMIPSTRATVKGKAIAGLKARREKERTWFLRDGIPAKDMGSITPTPEQEARQVEDKTQNPAVRETTPSSGLTSGSATDEIQNRKGEGFTDPNKQYPKKDWLGEPDTHRLARHEKIDQTIVVKKEAAREKGVKTARKKTWDQPQIPYNSIYPFNHTRVSETGHVEEWDDTQGNERLHWYHRTGTFEEIDVNGTKVTRVVGDNYEILDRNGNVYIKGNCFVTIEGESRVRIENNAYLEVLGDAYTDVSGNHEITVKGDFKLKAKSIQLEAYEGDIDVTAPIGMASIDALNVYLNSNQAVPSGLETPSEDPRGLPEFGELKVPDRSNEVMGNYETPDEGDGDEFVQNMVALGIIPADEVKPQEEKPEQENPVAEEKKPMPKEAPKKGCDLIYQTETFNAAFELIPGWRLGDVCKGRSGIPSGKNYGLSSQEIVCNLKVLTENVIDPIKKRFPNLIITNSWRSEAVNNSLPGASKTSDHLKGSAVDIQFSGFSRRQTYEAAIEIQKLLPEYDQILLEYMNKSMWVHVSFRSAGGNRMQVKTIDVYKRSNSVNGAFKLYE